MPKLIVQLQQNTPMIHFQAEEAGATLRATAVKPALDRFLIEICKSEPDIKSWMHDTTNKAFDYRMTFRAEAWAKVENEALKKYNNAQMPYFAKSDGVMCSESVTMTIISAKSDLVGKIRENIAAFFLLHNFGVRATKGYGSFQVVSTQMVSIDKKPVAVTCTEKAIWEAVKKLSGEDAIQAAVKPSGEFEPNLYKLPSGYGSWGAALADINSIYAQMKSGRNHPFRDDLYQPAVLSKLYRGVKRNLHGEKWWIKQNFDAIRRYAESCKHHPDAVQSETPYREQNARFLRAMLGLTDSYKFDIHGRDANYVVDIADNPKDQEKGIIQRFASPLIFKPVRIGGQLQVYILVKRIPDVMFDREFAFKYGGHTEKLKTPNQKEFSLVGFLDFVAGNDGGRLINKVEAGGEGI